MCFVAAWLEGVCFWEECWVLLVFTFGVQLGSVLGEALEANLVPQQLQELFQGGAGRLVVVHLLLAALARSAVHHPHLHLETQLGESREDLRRQSATEERSGGQPGPNLPPARPASSAAR